MAAVYHICGHERLTFPCLGGTDKGEGQMHKVFTIETQGPGLYEITREVEGFVAASRAEEALLTLFVRHTSASLAIQENADPDVRTDLAAFFHRLVPPSDDPAMGYIRHTSEGPDDMPAHIKAALLPVSLTIPIISGRMMLGTWQGIYLFEHRSSRHRREIVAVAR
ncbi:secondary thiamine-phosphate synthase enzyme [Maritimibacter sp. HL-12]|nr:secondary thiamine-phosphate synthase enzyme [Maritimibacter sp. HL-12]